MPPGPTRREDAGARGGCAGGSTYARREQYLLRATLVSLLVGEGDAAPGKFEVYVKKANNVADSDFSPNPFVNDMSDPFVIVKAPDGQGMWSHLTPQPCGTTTSEIFLVAASRREGPPSSNYI